MVLGKLPVLGRLAIWIIVGQGPTTLEVGAGGGCLDIFSLIYHCFSFLTPSLWETARYRLKYCLKGPLSPNQPTNQLFIAPALARCYIEFKMVAITKNSKTNKIVIFSRTARYIWLKFCMMY